MLLFRRRRRWFCCGGDSFSAPDLRWICSVGARFCWCWCCASGLDLLWICGGGEGLLVGSAMAGLFLGDGVGVVVVVMWWR